MSSSNKNMKNTADKPEEEDLLDLDLPDELNK
jgi:hypothetical protein